MPAATKKTPSQFDGLKHLGTGTPVAEVESTKRLVRGRPLKQGAKSRDGDFRPWGGYLRKETVNEANYELGKLSGDDSCDLSDLLEKLLAGWVANKKLARP